MFITTTVYFQIKCQNGVSAYMAQCDAVRATYWQLKAYWLILKFQMM